MNNMWEPIVTVLSGIIGVAIIAVLVSNKAQTGNVLGAAGSAFANALSAATAPVTGNGASPNVNGPTAGLGGLSLPSLGNITGNLSG